MISADKGVGKGVGWQKEVGRGRSPLLPISVNVTTDKKQNVAESTFKSFTESNSCEGSVQHVVLSPVSALHIKGPARH